MGKKNCELCDGVARMFCESDQASLCWNCDGKVHGANFLVAKHTRCLLCSVCQSPTPWKASGLRFGPTVSVCESCLARKNKTLSLKKEISSNDNHNDDDDCEEGEEVEAENQVVPGDVAPVMSSSSSVSSGEESFSGDGGLVVKRTRGGLDLDCFDGCDTSSTSSSSTLVLITAKKRRYKRWF
ncbi:hypothetical protein BRARA_J00918 [Brassica rapa]|uniref:B box-type domain-containing protein n=1 Tax=Brassica campestris TaxID=3711 RepID=A0A397XJA4_BRACM|nr:hypothetical protein BRARA_J00918 [Brassica rapa]CAG7909981.1 unnamed protein product [Brassica rapa]VDD17554.1 unnamed protein product [Brassica rapa]